MSGPSGHVFLPPQTSSLLMSIGTAAAWKDAWSRNLKHISKAGRQAIDQACWHHHVHKGANAAQGLRRISCNVVNPEAHVQAKLTSAWHPPRSCKFCRQSYSEQPYHRYRHKLHSGSVHKGSWAWGFNKTVGPGLACGSAQTQRKARTIYEVSYL
jgi:hypothetical protein